MPFIRYKKIYNKTYAYQVWKEKDQTGKWKQKTKYLGELTDPQTNTIQKTKKPTKSHKVCFH